MKKTRSALHAVCGALACMVALSCNSGKQAPEAESGGAAGGAPQLTPEVLQSQVEEKLGTTGARNFKISAVRPLAVSADFEMTDPDAEGYEPRVRRGTADLLLDARGWRLVELDWKEDAQTAEESILATMKGDLRNLATAQEGYASDNGGQYMPSGTAMSNSLWHTYGPSTSVTVKIVNAGPGWSAIATHSRLPRARCVMFVNTAPTPPATAQGEPACR